MAGRKRHNRGKGPANTNDVFKKTVSLAPTPSYTQYNARESRKALVKRGAYHPRINKTLQEVADEFATKLELGLDLPDEAGFLSGRTTPFQGLYVNADFLIVTETDSSPSSPSFGNSEPNSCSSGSQSSGPTSSSSGYQSSEPVSPHLRILNGSQPPGRLLGQLFASQGLKQLELIAIADEQGWNTLSQGFAIWDFTKGSFQGTPRGSVFLSIAPQISQGAFEQSPEMVKLENQALDQVCRLIARVRNNCGPTDAYWGDDERRRFKADGDSPEVQRDSAIWGRKLVKMIQSLENNESLRHKIKRVVDPPPHLDHYMSKLVATKLLFDLLLAICKRRNMVTVLQFHKTPLLDRRLVAIILRACPHVKMIGIYECPLIHFGDVMCLLDIIHEVNLERDKAGLPRVESFDFYPRYHAGMPYYNECGYDFDSYGITWRALNNNYVQRGVLAILLQAVLKSRRMGLGLLMDHGGAFMTYLSNLPMIPSTILNFLDGLYRYLDVKATNPGDVNALKRATYDMSKAIRAGIETLKDDGPRYMKSLGKALVFCSSCGYETLPEFFSGEQIRNQPHHRSCAACYLQTWLHEEKDHHKQEAKNIMSVFFPDWEPKAFNIDAPLLKDGQDLMRMKTRKVERGPEPSMKLLPNGEFFMPQFEIEFVRNGKIQDDSVQGLPDLETLLIDKPLHDQQMSDVALATDAERIVALLLRDQYPKPEGSRRSFAQTRFDGGAPDHYDERKGVFPERDLILNDGMHIMYGFLEAGIEDYRLSLEGF
ncbi:hypothetical protein FHETE_7663 [Fusarium heterosporum]|uniref:Uncharacterized protein n=1 Tax=Fusarium heterosporum TaxID=42747 RepID=A0A8H5T558_FUSHE|nr:hypothetical protein FHETE_7663 [Fusarium heterosporum]